MLITVTIPCRTTGYRTVLSFVLCVCLVLCACGSTGHATAVASITLTPDTVVGGVSATCTVSLDASAAAGGVAVHVSSNQPSAKVPPVVTIPAGATNATFIVQTTSVDVQVLATITGSVDASSQTASLTINPISLASLTVSQATMVGGYPCSGTLTLVGPAPTGGSKVQLSSSIGSVVPPATVTIPAGQTSATFSINTKRVPAQVESTITATLGIIATTATLTLVPEGPASISLNPPALHGGTASEATINLTGPAPKDGLTISLSSGNKAAILPASVKVAAGAASATFPIKTEKVAAKTTVAIVVKFGSQSKSANLDVIPPGVSSITLNPTSVVGSGNAGATLLLTEPAPSSGLPIKLSSDQPSASVPGQIVVPAGKTTYSFTIRTSAVAAPVTASIKALISGVAQAAGLTIQPPTLLSLALESPTIDGGSTTNATVTLGSPAPSAGITIILASNQKAATIPAKIVIPAGKTSATFAIKTQKVTAQTLVSINATFGAVTQTATLTLN